MADLPITSDEGATPVVLNDPIIVANVAGVTSTGALQVAGVPVGTQANAWNNAVVVANSNSSVVDCQYCSVITVFGNTSANVNPLRIQASQDNINFYTVLTTSISSGNWGLITNWGARYMRLQASQATTITATIAGKL